MPLATKKTGMKTPKPTAASLRAELGVGHPVVRVEVVEDRAGGEGAEDQLEPELLGERDHPDQQHERAADADLGARVLEAAQRRRDPPRALGAGDARSRRRRSPARRAPIRISFASVPVASPEKSSVSSSTEAKSAIEAAAITSWPNRERDLARRPGAPGRSPRARSRRG